MRWIGLVFIFLTALFWSGIAAATWSVVAVDPETGEVGGAAATCTPWADAIIGAVPGEGVIVTQAQSNKTARRHGENLLRKGWLPDAIVTEITQPEFDPAFARQQHGIVSLRSGGKAAGFSGAKTASYSGDLQGAHVSLQGNILTGPDVLTAGLAAFQTAADDPAKSLAERLLMALEAGAQRGGDRRCGKQTALSAYLVVYARGDGPGHPTFELSASQLIRGGESAVQILRAKFDRYKDQQQP